MAAHHSIKDTLLRHSWSALIAGSILQAFTPTSFRQSHPLLLSFAHACIGLASLAFAFDMRKPASSTSPAAQHGDEKAASLEPGWQLIPWRFENPSSGCARAVRAWLILQAALMLSTASLEAGILPQVFGIPECYVMDRHGNKMSVTCEEHNLASGLTADGKSNAPVPPNATFPRPCGFLEPGEKPDMTKCSSYSVRGKDLADLGGGGVV